MEHKWERKRTAWKRSLNVVVDRGYRREERREDEMLFRRGNGRRSGGVVGPPSLVVTRLSRRGRGWGTIHHLPNR